jgi:DNA-binding LacI/PurR family transcriptional regulator
MGRSAAEKLIALIDNPKATIIERVVIPGVVLPGQSVYNLKGRNK